MVKTKDRVKRAEWFDTARGRRIKMVWQEVEGYRLTEHFATKRVGRTWEVDHIPTGARVASVSTKAIAAQVAESLERRRVNWDEKNADKIVISGRALDWARKLNTKQGHAAALAEIGIF